MGQSVSKDHKIRTKYLKECLKKFDSHELEVLQKIYKELSGKSSKAGIDKEIFLQYFNLPGLWGEQLFKIFNINESESVGLDEFLMGIAVSCRGTRSEKIYVLFKVFDLNNDNFIQKSELIAMLSNFPKLTKYLSRSTKSDDLSYTDDEHPANLEDWSVLGQPYNLRSDYNKRNTLVQPDDHISHKIKQIARKSHKDFKPLHEIALSLSKFSFSSGLSLDSIPRSSILLLQNTSELRKFRSIDNISTINAKKVPLHERSFSDHTLDCKTHLFPKRSRPLSDCSDVKKSNHSSFLHTEDGLYDSSDPLSDDHEHSTIDMPSPKSLPDLNRPSPKGTAKLLNRSTDDRILDFADINFNRLISDHTSKTNSIECKNMLQPDDPTFILVKSIIEENDEQEKLEKSNLKLDILVEQIFEECEFNENGSLSFVKFKAWLEKNDSILEMFSECLHEEVWGLQGNAFFREYCISDDDSFLCRGTDFTYLSSSECIDASKLSRKGTSVSAEKSSQIDNVTKRLIYQMFLVNGLHTLNFTSCSRTFNGVVSEELVKHMKNFNSILLPNKENSKQSFSGTEHSSSKFIYEIFACPSCKTTFFICPRCYSRHTSLSLHIDVDVIYIRCSNCSESGGHVFKICWFCDWDFKEIFRNPEIAKRTLSSPQPCSDENNSNSFASSGSYNLSSTESIDITKSNISKSKSQNEDTFKHRQSNSYTKSGIMYKIGKTLHQWRSRFYVLNGNILYYYKDKSSARPKGCIFLEGCYLEPLRKRYVGNKYGFSIYQKNNKLSKRDFYVETKEQFLDWVEVLSQAMKQQSLTSMYEICEQLGQGKFSIVYRAICKETHEEYAVKIIDKTKIFGQERELLRSEISILKLLKHAHVIYLKEIIDMKDSLYIVMELVRGGELYDLIHSEHRLSEEHTHKIITQLLQTVAYLHKCGIIHRDLKPENLLLTDKTESAAIKLTDFGLSTLCGPNDVLTQPCGTLAYVAPEVLTMQGYNQKADVWSIGVIMYLLIRGRLPFAINKAVKNNIWDHYRVSFEGSVWRGISSSAKDLIRKLLEPDPSKRISVFEALDHIWVKNFVAVNRDSSTFLECRNSASADQSLPTETLMRRVQPSSCRILKVGTRTSMF